MSRWICTKACRALDKNYREGQIEDHPTNPASAYFEAYSGDKILPVNKLPKTDLDGTYYFPKPGWDDLRFPFTRDRQGVAQKPDYDFTNMGLLFPQDNPTEVVFITVQMSHSMQIGSDLHPHIHYVQDSAEVPVFKMDYRWYENGGDPTGSFTTIAADNFTFPYASGSILQIVSFPDLDGSAIVGVSSMLDIKIYRDDDVVAGDVLAKEFDMHYRIDSLGSGREYNK